MEQHHDLAALLDQVKSLIATQTLPGQPPSNNNINTNTNINNDTNNPPSLLPTSIPPLPQSCLNLPPSPSINKLTTLLQTHILPSLSHSSLSPNYYGFIIGGTTPAALLADILVSIYDQNVHVHLPHDTIATAVEVAALNLLVELFRLPAEWRVGVQGGHGGGVFTTSATASNVLGLAVGREWVVAERGRRNGNGERSASVSESGSVSVAKMGLLAACHEVGVTGIEVLSSMPHSSVVKAAAVLGIGRECVIDIGREGDPVGLDVERLETLAKGMEAQGKVYILVISAGEVNTGRFATGGYDTMVRVRKICDTYGIWIHADGAFGLFGRVLMNLSAEEQWPYAEVISGVEGIELADSITGDAHKLLNVPYDCGLFFTRHKAINEVVFGNGDAAYLKTAEVVANGSMPGQDYEAGSDIQSPLNMGIENSRRFRALPVWATLMAYGRDGYVELLRRQIGLARRVLEIVWADERLEVLPKTASRDEALRRTFMVVMLRAKDEVVNQGLVKRINATKKMYVSGTQWDGRPAARIAVSNWQVDVERDSALIKEVIDQCL